MIFDWSVSVFTVDFTSYNELLDITQYVNTDFSLSHAVRKTKFHGGNNQPHVTRDLRKAILKQSRLKTSLINLAYRRQRNLVVNMNRLIQRKLS